MTKITRPKGRVLGLDIGKKRIGSALSDELLITTSPFRAFEVKSLNQTLKEIVTVCRDHKVGVLVVGVPFELDGSEGEQTNYTVGVIKKLMTAFNPKALEDSNLVLNTLMDNTDPAFYLLDERYTSVQAEGLIKNKKLKNEERRKEKDNMSALILVETFIMNVS